MILSPIAGMEVMDVDRSFSPNTHVAHASISPLLSPISIPASHPPISSTRPRFLIIHPPPIPGLKRSIPRLCVFHSSQIPAQHSSYSHRILPQIPPGIRQSSIYQSLLLIQYSYLISPFPITANTLTMTPYVLAFPPDSPTISF